LEILFSLERGYRGGDDDMDMDSMDQENPNGNGSIGGVKELYKEL
jgi:hypothetical protein